MSALSSGDGSVGKGTYTRVAMVFSSTLRTKSLETIDGTKFTDAVKSIVLTINPNNISFQQPKRITKMDKRDGSVFFHFSNSKGQNNDILKINFQGNTGNIDRRAYAGQGDKADITNMNHLLNWHQLYLLSREPMLLAGGIRNEMTISYTSALFPSGVTFTGFFSAVLAFSENAQKPFTREYNFEFTVTKSSPSLDKIGSNVGKLITQIRDEKRSSGEVGVTVKDGVNISYVGKA